MEYLNSLLNWQDMTPLKAIKIIGVAILILLLLAFALQLIFSSFKMFSSEIGLSVPGVMQGSAPYSMGGGVAYDYDAAYVKEESYAGMPQLSARNVASTVYPPMPMSPSGDDAEKFEVTQYSATIETRKLDRSCAAFGELKARQDVIFESANTYDRGCSYTFKVKHESVEEVLTWLRDLNPKELSENTYTIKRQIDDYTNEVEVLEKKRASVDDTLTKALSAYDEITRLATNTQNADALAQIINSKIAIIERLTQERISINEQLDRLARAKADELDRLEYTYFHVNVYENKFVDGDSLMDSWKRAVSSTVNEINEIIQKATLGLFTFLFLVAQWLIYALIVLVIAKYGWKFARDIWNR